MEKRPAFLAFTTISLLVISSGALRAQGLAPATLNLASHDQKAADDMVQIITSKSVQETADRPVHAVTKPRGPVIVKKLAPPVKKEPASAIAADSARAFVAEPVRPMDQQTVGKTTKRGSLFSFKSPEGKKESVPVITQYYPKQMVYPFGRVDRHIDTRLMQAASIAEERAHAHSRSQCWHYVKEALLASGVIDSRPKTELARDAASELVSNYGFKKLSVNDPFSAPVGSVLVYGTSRSVGHVEFRTRDGFVSDFRSKTPSRRPLLGVYAKL
ncbi:MAG: hypothetical protein DMF24_07965 [Verrucomicrobia bacterium]|nr:MAG: hypothetical protein DMF24_07965 [Verrucomicrobiota bacterium]